MGHRSLIRQKEGKGAKRCWLDNLLYQDRPPINGYLLGEVECGKLILGRNVRPLCVTPIRASCSRVLQGRTMVSHARLRQQMRPQTLLTSQKTIRPSAKCTDIQCNLRAIKQSFTGNFQYFHVYGHMDKYLRWEQRRLIQQLNCICNTLAKRAITTTTLQDYHSRQSQFLPKEDVAPVIWRNKVTGDILSPLRFHTSKEVARQHLRTCTKDKWSNNKFDAVDWEHLDLTLKNKPDMYKIWRSKQNLGFLGTRVQVGCYSGNTCPDKRCPNCRCQETATHIMLCPNEDCTKLLIENVNKLTEWMAQDNRTNPEILYWIPKYILMRRDKPLSEMGTMSPQFKALACSQDLIGWGDFTKGYISTHFYEIQSFHLAMSSSYLNGEDWNKQFISKLLQITHSQWIYHNISLHNRHHGYLHTKNAKDIMRDIESLSSLAPEAVPEASGFLLELISPNSPNFISKLKSIGHWR
jgi:hypothetical protein